MRTTIVKKTHPRLRVTVELASLDGKPLVLVGARSYYTLDEAEQFVDKLRVHVARDGALLAFEEFPGYVELATAEHVRELLETLEVYIAHGRAIERAGAPS